MIFTYKVKSRIYPHHILKKRNVGTLFKQKNLISLNSPLKKKKKNLQRCPTPTSLKFDLKIIVPTNQNDKVNYLIVCNPQTFMIIDPNKMFCKKKKTFIIIDPKFLSKRYDFCTRLIPHWTQFYFFININIKRDNSCRHDEQSHKGVPKSSTIIVKRQLGRADPTKWVGPIFCLHCAVKSFEIV